MANKVIKIPISSVDGLNKDGGYSLRYRVVSQDGNRKSQWSEIANINYASPEVGGFVTGRVLSFYERVATNNNPPKLSFYNLALPTDPLNGLDPHTLAPPEPYVIEQVIDNLNPETYISSGISMSKDTQGVLEYKWDSLEKYADLLQQKFDVYLSFKNEIDAWQGWTFAGTTTANVFSFTAPTGRLQQVQAAVFISSYPKLDNIHSQETNFISISPVFNVYRNEDGPVTVVAGTTPATGGMFTATVSGLVENFPADGWAGRKVYANSSAGNNNRTGFAEDVTVRSRSGTGSFVIQSSAVIGSLSRYNLSLVS